MKVLIADDHDLVREMIANYLSREGQFSVTLAANLDEALEKIASDGPFDLTLLDYDMPGMNGLAGLTQALEANAGQPVALMSGVASRSIAEEALESGAAGFVPKTLGTRTLVNAMRFMAAGEIFAPANWISSSHQEPQHPLREMLTERELQALEGLSQGKSNKEIALGLGLQEVTVKLHMRTLCRKLGARNRVQAAMIAKNAGLF